MNLRLIVVPLLLLTATGCSLAPSSDPPAIDVPGAWRAPADTTVVAPADTIADAWWTAFGDTTLDALVAEALDANRDLMIAVARVDQARALARIAGAERLPQIDARGAYSKTRQSQSTGVIPLTADPVSERFEASAIGAFELDLFGRVRNETAAAHQDLMAASYTSDAIRLAVISDVAATYFDLAALDRQAEVTRATVDSRRETYQLIEERFSGGLVSQLDLQRARAERAAAEAALPEIERLRRATENRLAILLGRMPGPIARGRSLEELAAPAVPAELPSSLLWRRPDVAAAEAQLAASSARIGAARANLFPSINLTGTYGSASSDLSDLFTGPALIWNFGAGLLQPIFHGGRNRALVAAAQARQREAVAVYLQTAQGAFQDVEDALFAVSAYHERRLALQDQSEALTNARALAGDRYREGESSFLDVLDVERSRLAAELQYAGARRDELKSAVELYRALGGGFHRQ
ncbi:MAG TPA: efflux transporter outer membrane subunit [Candidatus Krumholzibacteria bacterium]|nr:efflux transporter outer membrane subunit [Candidatus Krumholzibacteria bacterium]